LALARGRDIGASAMTTARLLLTLFGSLQGRHVLSQTTVAPIVIAPTLPATAAVTFLPGTTSVAPGSVTATVPASLAPPYPDQSDPNCVVGQSCSTGTLVGTKVPVRGLCVTSAGQNWCWDACNLNHTLTSFSQTNTAGIALMVKQLRTGMRFGSCPGATFTPTCNPGERCTPPGLTWGRGMCITISGKGNQCLDMCNFKLPLDTFKATPGKQAGTVQIVEMVRAGRDPAGLTTCPMASVWIWLWIPLVLCCAIGLCAVAYYLFNYYKKINRRGGSSKYREPEEPYVEDQAPYADYQQVAPQDQDFEMAPPQTMDQMDQTMDPMPVVDDYQGPPAAEPFLEEQAQALGTVQPNIFDQPPNLMAGLAPQTVLQPMGTMYPGAQPTYAAPMMAYQQPGFPQAAYPQAASMSLAGSAMQQPRPVYTTSMTNPMTTGLPAQYGAYGAYGNPATTSMRIG